VVKSFHTLVPSSLTKLNPEDPTGTIQECLTAEHAKIAEKWRFFSRRGRYTSSRVQMQEMGIETDAKRTEWWPAAFMVLIATLVVLTRVFDSWHGWGLTRKFCGVCLILTLLGYPARLFLMTRNHRPLSIGYVVAMAYLLVMAVTMTFSR
jgi:hypothetical protein